MLQVGPAFSHVLDEDVTHRPSLFIARRSRVYVHIYAREKAHEASYGAAPRGMTVRGAIIIYTRRIVRDIVL